MNSRKQLHAALGSFDRLPGQAGREFWRSLDELADDPSFQKLMMHEFPAQASVWPDSLSRRKFLSLMGASLALAGLSGCSVRPAPSTQVVPYVNRPEELIPGRPLFFATAFTHGGEGMGVLVESHEGRPTKIEGNPDHPGSRGATDVFAQASILSLYDPDRAQTVTHHAQPRTWDEAANVLRTAIDQQRPKQGSGLRLLTGAVLSPTLGVQLDRLLAELPQARRHVWEPVHADGALQASERAFGRPLDVVYDFSQADVIVSLDADFLIHGPGHLRHARDFIDRRRMPTVEDQAAAATMNRLYVVEPAISCTGAKADHRLAVRDGEIAIIAQRLATRLGVAGVESGPQLQHDRWIAAVADDLNAHRARSLVIAGHRQPAAVHLLAAAMNDRLGNVGSALRYIEPIEWRPTERSASLGELIEAADRGEVETLLILDANPAYTAPADAAFLDRLQKVPLRIAMGLYRDETA
ncbi:MAG TPA: TAT-variant-translocated molybdopterin oxidoreductase, partial [Pirellulales bacterium]|nr:TAT-variant-translocated molybdopterin oxidoreductase [Pirellulales bacterium]